MECDRRVDVDGAIRRKKRGKQPNYGEQQTSNSQREGIKRKYLEEQAAFKSLGWKFWYAR